MTGSSVENVEDPFTERPAVLRIEVRVLKSAGSGSMECIRMIEQFERVVLTDSKSGLSTPPAERTYDIGTLRYTVRQLVFLFTWLLAGNFCFIFFEQIFGRMMPLYLKQLHASNTVIGLLTGSIAGLVNVLFLPNISVATDRYRSRLGRRVPFLLWSTPCTVLSLMLIGYGPEISRWLHTAVPALRVFSLGAMTLVLLGMFTVSWHFFNMVLVNLFNFLVRDVVPQKLIARYVSLGFIINITASMLFTWFIFPHILINRKIICVVVGLIYLAAFVLMCWRVKEGEYPPPEPRPPGGFVGNYLKTFLAYFRECLSVPIYRDFVIVYALIVAAGSTAPFSLLFLKKTIHLSMTDMGRVFTLGSLLSALVVYPIGILCNRITAIRLLLIALTYMTVATLMSYFFINGLTSWIVFTVITVAPGTAWGIAQNTLMLSLFPVERFGQFFSSINVLGFGSIFISNYLVGALMDWLHSDYRMTFIISFVCYLATVPMLYKVYRHWLRHGGPHHYVPPLPVER